MNDLLKGLNEAAKTIYQNNAAKGFWDKDRSVGETLMLVNTELCEALEADREGNYADWKAYEDALRMKLDSNLAFKEHIKDTHQDEIADAIIRLLDYCGKANIDIERHISAKVAYNATRPRLHGKKY